MLSLSNSWIYDNFSWVLDCGSICKQNVIWRLTYMLALFGKSLSLSYFPGPKYLDIRDTIFFYSSGGTSTTTDRCVCVCLESSCQRVATELTTIMVVYQILSTKQCIWPDSLINLLTFVLCLNGICLFLLRPCVNTCRADSVICPP